MLLLKNGLYGYTGSLPFQRCQTVNPRDLIHLFAQQLIYRDVSEMQINTQLIGGALMIAIKQTPTQLNPFKYTFMQN